MPFQTKIQTVCVGRCVLCYVLLVLLAGCSQSSSKSEQDPDSKLPLAQTPPGSSVQTHPGNSIDTTIETAPTVSVTVIAEQDPTGIFWGLRDTVTGKLVSGYAFQRIFTFKEGFALVLLNGKYGLIDRTGKVIIEPACDYPKSELACGCIAFAAGYGPVVILDTAGKALMPAVSGMTGLLPCRKRITFGSNGFGMVDFKGDTILPFKFREAYLLPEGFCVACDLNHLYGLYDLNGKQVLPHVYEHIDGFFCGRAIVKKNGKYGVIDQTGKELFYTEYSRFDRYTNNYALVYKSQKNGEITVGIIDRNGREIVPANYQWLDYLFNFSEGLAAMAQNGKYGFVDTTGKTRIPFKYDKVESFSKGIAKVWVGWKYVGYIDMKGAEVIPAHFEAMDQANLRRYQNKFVIGLKDSAWHVFDHSGKEIATLPYEQFGEFNEHEKTFQVSLKNKWGILDSNFQVKIPVEYESLETIFPGKIACRKNNKIGFINQEGKTISPFNYDGIGPFQDNRYEDGLALVELKGKKGLINSHTRLVIPVKYDEIEGFSFGLAIVKRKNKYGFVNAKGKEILPAIYDKAGSYNGYSAEVTLKGETFQIDSSGKRLEEEY